MWPLTISDWVFIHASTRWRRTAADAATYTSAGLACSTVTPWVYFSCSRISSANCSAVTADFGAVISVMNRLL